MSRNGTSSNRDSEAVAVNPEYTMLHYNLLAGDRSNDCRLLGEDFAAGADSLDSQGFPPVRTTTCI